MKQGNNNWMTKDGEDYIFQATEEERIADSLEKLVQLMDYQNKMLTSIANDIRKRK